MLIRDGIPAYRMVFQRVNGPEVEHRYVRLHTMTGVKHIRRIIRDWQDRAAIRRLLDEPSMLFPFAYMYTEKWDNKMGVYRLITLIIDEGEFYVRQRVGIDLIPVE